MLFPDLGVQYLDQKDSSLLRRMNSFYMNSSTANQARQQEGLIDNRFFCGDANLYGELYGANIPGRRQNFNFNLIRPLILNVSGEQSKNRKSTIVIPVENGDQETADQFTKVLSWVHRQNGTLMTISEAFKGALVSGMDLLEVTLDFRNDTVSGNIRVERVPGSKFYIDPFFTKKDLSDCNGIFRRSYIPRTTIITMFPGREEEIMSLPANETGRDGKFTYTAESLGWTNNFNLLTYDEFYYPDFRTQQLLIDTETGETMEWTGDDEALKLYLLEFPTIKVEKTQIATVKVGIVVQGKVMYDGVQSTGLDRYPFCPVWAYYSPELPNYPDRVQSMVRGLRDTQYLFTRRKLIALDQLESQITSGWKYKENALINPEDVFTVAGNGKGLALKDSAQMSDVEQIIPIPIAQTTLAVEESLNNLFNEVSGISETQVGSSVQNVAGFLEMMRQNAGKTTLQGLFDDLDESQRILGEIEIEVIQKNFAPGKIKKILEGEEPTEQFYNKNFGRYGAAIEDGLNTTTQRQLQFAQMLQLREAGVNIPESVMVEASTLQNKKELMQALEKQAEQQQKISEMQMQLQQQQAEAQIALAKARATADTGLGIERVSRVEENRALAIRQEAEAVHEQDAAVLDKIKAIKELEEMDIKHIRHYVDMINSLKAQDVAQQQAQQQMQDQKEQVKESAQNSSAAENQ